MIQRYKFDERLDKLHKEIMIMSSIVEEMLRDSVKSLINKDDDLARKVIERDDDVDEKEIMLQELCIKIIATQQPVATDLRTIASVFKILTNLERIADHAVNIAETTLDLIKEDYIKPLIDIPKLSEIALESVKISIDSYVNQDITTLDAMIDKENQIDSLFRKIYRDLLEYMIEDPKNIKQAARFTFVASYLERVGDHGTNIFESVHYIVTGEYKDFKDLEGVRNLNS